MSLVRKMMRHGVVVVAKGVSTKRVRPKSTPKGTPRRRSINDHFHATKGPR